MTSTIEDTARTTWSVEARLDTHIKRCPASINASAVMAAFRAVRQPESKGTAYWYAPSTLSQFGDIALVLGRMSAIRQARRSVGRQNARIRRNTSVKVHLKRCQGCNTSSLYCWMMRPNGSRTLCSLCGKAWALTQDAIGIRRWPGCWKTETSCWRSGEAGKATLCNSCGSMWAQYRNALDFVAKAEPAVTMEPGEISTGGCDDKWEEGAGAG